MFEVIIGGVVVLVTAVIGFLMGGNRQKTKQLKQNLKARKDKDDLNKDMKEMDDEGIIDLLTDPNRRGV